MHAHRCVEGTILGRLDLVLVVGFCAFQRHEAAVNNAIDENPFRICGYFQDNKGIDLESFCQAGLASISCYL
jgi:hypothetical protein